MATKLTKLDAVNIVISNIGQAPVTVIDNDNPMVALAANTIDEVTNSVQSEGWSFNTEREYPFNPMTDGRIQIPMNVLQIDTGYRSDKDVVLRQDVLLQRSNTEQKSTTS